MTATSLTRPSRGIVQTLTALGVVLFSAPAAAATITVHAGCTIQNAMHSANADSAVGGCSAGSGADTIVLQPSSTIVLTSPDNTWHNGTGLPVVTSDITIEGRGSTIERDASAPEFRIFGVEFGDLTLNDTTVSGGVAPGPDWPATGGGIQGYYGSIELDDCVITGNSAVHNGSAISVHGARLTTYDTTIAGNAGPEAIFSGFGTIELNRTALTLNEGDGIYAIAGPTTLNDCTVSSNGGDGLAGYWFMVHRSTITGNGGAGITTYYTRPTFSQSIITGNHGALGREITWDSNYGDVPATDFNIFGFSGDAGLSGFAPGATDIVPSGALASILDPSLAANGGPTLTHLIRSTGPARDAAPACSGLDQRGVVRPQGASCDIGSVELVQDPCSSAVASSGCTVNGVAGQPCVGGNGADVIVGTSGDDVILGRGGNDTVWAAAGNDVVCGGDGDDALHGGSGADLLFGGSGTDALWGDHGADSVSGGTGVDACTTDASDVSIVTCN